MEEEEFEETPQLPEEMLINEIQIAFRLSKEVIAKCAALSQHFKLPVPNTKKPKGEGYVYHRLIKGTFLAMLDAYFTSIRGEPPKIIAPDAKRIEQLFFLMHNDMIDNEPEALDLIMAKQNAPSQPDMLPEQYQEISSLADDIAAGMESDETNGIGDPDEL